ncbi:MAG: DUF1512 family protein [Candidatus Aenigmarchaeota archaeon]|nr:DUF1512 domain-containing protein [Candidatus Aenigmarchaeota archaeon]MCX8191027.1 DUF1512 domain-containing protein [Candidatus Aenigmarchaeota archaeon]MDW8160317.1 DUF1512 family protein [Candidatus Aenigmarchaeota archaeon]
MFLYQSDFPSILWILLFFLMMMFYPRLLLYQLIARFTRTAMLLESLASKGKNTILRKLKNGGEDVRKKLDSFLNFFVIPPVSLDPFGIIKKLEHMENLEESKFLYFVERVGKNLTDDEKWNVISALSAEIGVYQLSKIVKHYIELIQKTNSYQLALILQMQLTMIEKYSKSMYKAIEALSEGKPIGDSAGPLLASFFIKKKPKEIDNMVYSLEKIHGKRVVVLKAKGPGARIGKLGRVAEFLIDKYKIEKIITVDAAVKLESEKTGEIAEGVGVAIGGIGVEKATIEEIATKKKIVLDSYVVKMSQEEALLPMKEEILEGVKKVKGLIESNIKESKEKRILLIGVGNTSGIPNVSSDLEKTIEEILENSKRIKKWEEEEKKKEEKFRWFLGP